MRIPRPMNERGVALIMTLLLTLVIAGMATGIILMTSNGTLIARFHANEAEMEAAADAGLELGRDTLNGTPSIVALGSSFDTLEFNAPVKDASGNVIPGFTRSVYAGATGNSTGQFGIFASIISVINNSRGAVVVRRAELKQDSFSRFAHFFNTWNNGIMYGNQEVVFGPVHSNQGLVVQTRNGYPGATFWGPVSVVAASVTNQNQANWNGGLTTSAPAITFPTVQTLQNLQSYATTGNTVVTGYGTANAVDPDTRVEFVAIDLNGDGQLTGANEGFFRVYKADQTGNNNTRQDRRNYVTAREMRSASPNSSSDNNMTSPNCGGTWSVADGGDGGWWTADSIYHNTPGSNTAKATAVRNALNSATRRCYLGGDRRLYPGQQYRVSDDHGAWQPWSGWGGVPPAALVAAIQAQGVAPGFTAAQVAETFWPLSRSLNPNFKGVIYVNGSVGVSGLVRGRVTLVATGNIMLADDITYVTPPGTTCADILGLLTPGMAYIEDNSIQGIWKVGGSWQNQFDESTNETYEAFLLTLQSFAGENYFPNPSEPLTAPEACGGASRGCKLMIGGTIQQAIDATYSSRGGWAEQDTYDKCGEDDPPPYYPTTGRFSKNRYYEIDPVGFNVATWFANNQP